jgi:hypothetical protein
VSGIGGVASDRRAVAERGASPASELGQILVGARQALVAASRVRLDTHHLRPRLTGRGKVSTSAGFSTHGRALDGGVQRAESSATKAVSDV